MIKYFIIVHMVFLFGQEGVVENAVKINTKAGKDLYFYDTKSCYEHIKNNKDDLKSYAAYVFRDVPGALPHKISCKKDTNVDNYKT